MYVVVVGRDVAPLPSAACPTTPPCPQVHRGVYEAAQQLYDRFLPLVQDHLASSPFAKVGWFGQWAGVGRHRLSKHTAAPCLGVESCRAGSVAGGWSASAAGLRAVSLTPLLPLHAAPVPRSRSRATRWAAAWEPCCCSCMCAAACCPSQRCLLCTPLARRRCCVRAAPAAPAPAAPAAAAVATAAFCRRWGCLRAPSGVHARWCTGAELCWLCTASWLSGWLPHYPPASPSSLPPCLPSFHPAAPSSPLQERADEL